ncbi:alanine-tRNA synthetase second additional domain-containing protein [Clostridium sediminicola]|uniref:alanine-tRNA synthetase second additional domain-containing protein n=1 Tax=Clostridium sediminicola TaxID=3114879 RepID=UPI0031F25427
MALSLLHEALMYSMYFAPRGKKRLLLLGHQIAQRYLSPMDKLIGFIGDAGAGKSLLIKGMFPGLELTSDDEGVNVRPLPLLDLDNDNKFFSAHTYHLDVRFESAFTQMHVLADAVKQAIRDDKRVIIEHFELIYPFLNMNAEILIGIGEEVIVTRPSIFGPQPNDIAHIVVKSLKYRKMAHTAEDITSMVLDQEFGIPRCEDHNDVQHGFVLEFNKKPKINLEQLEEKVKEYIDKRLDVCYVDDKHIAIGNEIKYHCTGPRIHVRNTEEIKNFQIIKEYKYDPISKNYSIIGLVGSTHKIDPQKSGEINDLKKLQF